MNPAPSLRKKRGFTMIETLTALMVMSVLVRLGIPNYQEVRLKAEAASVAGDFEVVKLAAIQYQADNQGWPRDFAAGQVPPELVSYLPDGFSFLRGRYQLDWENWALSSGLPSKPDARAILGISIVTQDRALGAALEELLGNNAAHFSLGRSYTFVLETQ